MHDVLNKLNDAWGQPERVTFSQSPLGGPVVTLAGPAGTVVVALQGAQLLSWTPTGHDPVIWLSPVARLGSGKVVRGGTPVCWPWFAGHPTDPAKPAHGFVRTREWLVLGAGVTDTGAWVQLGTGTTVADAVLWPHQATAQVRVTLDRQLGLALRTTNAGDAPFALSQALHTYFCVGDIADVEVSGFDGETYLDKLDGGNRHSQAGAIAFPGEVDRIYDAHTREASITDRQLRRRIDITQSGSRSAVVWNPGPDKASRLGDMGPDGWRRFVCVETANAGRDVIQLNAGDTHMLGATYAVSRL
jgi:glucose-6-phosphate 1-epimerase